MIARTSRPDKTRSLPNGYLYTGNVAFAGEVLGNLLVAGNLKKTFERFDEVTSSLLDGVSLTSDANLRAQCHEAVAFSSNDGGQI